MTDPVAQLAAELVSKGAIVTHDRCTTEFGAAIALGLSQRTLRNARSDGEGGGPGFIRREGRVFYALSVLLEYRDRTKGQVCPLSIGGALAQPPHR